jgi:hypothetical protein
MQVSTQFETYQVGLLTEAAKVPLDKSQQRAGLYIRVICCFELGFGKVHRKEPTTLFTKPFCSDHLDQMK